MISVLPREGWKVDAGRLRHGRLNYCPLEIWTGISGPGYTCAAKQNGLTAEEVHLVMNIADFKARLFSREWWLRRKLFKHCRPRK